MEVIKITYLTLKTTNIFHFMTKDYTTNRLGVIGDYPQWDRRTNRTMDIATTRLNRPRANAVKIKNIENV